MRSFFCASVCTILICFVVLEYSMIMVVMQVMAIMNIKMMVIADAMVPLLSLRLVLISVLVLMVLPGEKPFYGC